MRLGYESVSSMKLMVQTFAESEVNLNGLSYALRNPKRRYRRRERLSRSHATNSRALIKCLLRCMWVMVALKLTLPRAIMVRELRAGGGSAPRFASRRQRATNPTTTTTNLCSHSFVFSKSQLATKTGILLLRSVVRVLWELYRQ